MSVTLEIVCTDRQIDAFERQEITVRAIGEILPYVLAKYGIDQMDRRPELPQRFNFLN